MEEAIEIIDPQSVRSALQTFAIWLENFQRFSEDHYNESKQLEVKNLCDTIGEEYESINSKLGEAEKTMKPSNTKQLKGKPCNY